MIRPFLSSVEWSIVGQDRPSAFSSQGNPSKDARFRIHIRIPNI
jgi:hypothetical protein